MRMKSVPFGLVLSAAVAWSAVAAAQPSEATAAGLWQKLDPKTGKPEGWFLIVERNGVYEGQIAKMYMEPGEDPNPVCSRCEGDQKGAPWLGLTIITGMKRHGSDYENGHILDPRNGNVYNAVMHLSPDGQTLTVRGYLGFQMFGSDQTWTRLPQTAYAELDPTVFPQSNPTGAVPAPRRSPSRVQGSAPR